jgi:type I restriction enzyme S subunit
MNWADREYAIGRGLAAVRHKCGSQYQHFIKAALDHGKELLLKSATGSTFPSINKDLLLSMPVQIPPLPIQKAIAGTLSCLDTKIELNNRINENLEAQAQAVFKSWFVDFEPFQDGEFVESELGLIPEGWRVGTISDLGEVIGGSTPSKKVNEYYGDQGIPWITPKDLSLSKTKFVARGQVDITEEGLRNSSTRIIPKGTVLFSSRAPIGYIAIAKNEVTTNQGFKSVVPKASVGTEYTYCFLKNNIDTIEARASGSTFKEVSGAIMKRVPALIPSEEILEKFTAATCSIFRLQETLEEQNLNLASLRDTLLPKLMSGEIEVPVE